MAARYLTDKPLLVKPELIGAPLASPLRRFVAFGIDYALLIVPTIVVAIAAALLSLWMRDPQGVKALVGLFRSGGGDQQVYADRIRTVLPLLVRFNAEELPCTVVAAFEAGEIDRAVDLVKDRNIAWVYSISEAHTVPTDAKTLTLHFDKFIPKSLRAVVLFAVGALYFTFMTMGGATLGKRLAGIRVVRLDGHRLTLLESLERFVGYLHIPGSLGISLLDLWRDPNRRQAHDRVVHTAVIRWIKPRPKPHKAVPAKPAPPPPARS